MTEDVEARAEQVIRIRESVVTTRADVIEEYTPERIREVWAGESADTCLVLALLEKWEAALAEVRTLREQRDQYARGCNEWNEMFETWRAELMESAERERDHLQERLNG